MNELTEYSRQVERHRDEGWRNLDSELLVFALSFVSCSSYVVAAKEAGLSNQRGRLLLSNPLVRALIADLQKEQYQTNIITEELIRTKLLELLPKLMGEEEVPIVLSNGAMVMEKKFFPGEARAALESLGKSIGMTDHKTPVIPIQVIINTGDLVGETRTNAPYEESEIGNSTAS